MTITLRLTKGEEVTYAELDANFIDLDQRLNQATTVLNPLVTEVAALPKFELVDSQVQALVGGGKTLTLTPSYPAQVLSNYAVASSSVLTATNEILGSFTIPAGTLSANSNLQIEALWSFSNSVDDKIVKIKIGPNTLYSATHTTTVKASPLVMLTNRNSLASQIYDIPSGTSAPGTSVINFALDQTVEFYGQRENAADTLTLQHYRILHFVGA